MSARRVGLRDVAALAGFKSHNYLAIRLRDEKPFTLDDVDLLSRWLREEPLEFLERSWTNHGVRLAREAYELVLSGEHDPVDLYPEFRAYMDDLAGDIETIDDQAVWNGRRQNIGKELRAEAAERLGRQARSTHANLSVVSKEQSSQVRVIRDAVVEAAERGDHGEARRLAQEALDVIDQGVADSGLAPAARKVNREPGLTKRRREHDEATEAVPEDPTGMEPI